MKPGHYASGCVNIGGLDLHYLDYGGTGRPPLLCIHGSGAHAHWYDFVGPVLSNDYHVLSLDLRGHGDSSWVAPPEYQYANYAADIEAFAEALDLREFTLMGHSMGGSVSLVYTATYPRRVSKLIIIDSRMKPSHERLATMREIGARAGREYASLEALLHHYRLRPESPFASAEVVQYIGSSGARQFPDGKWRHKIDRNVYATREPFDVVPCWASVRVPALIAKAERSQITPALVEQVKALCPHVRVVEVPRTSHHVTLDNPDGFVTAVRQFLT